MGNEGFKSGSFVDLPAVDCGEAAQDGEVRCGWVDVGAEAPTYLRGKCIYGTAEAVPSSEGEIHAKRGYG